MRIAIDFDGTIVAQDHPYDDLETPLRFLPHAKEGLHALERAGHQLILYSARANLSLNVNPSLNPLNDGSDTFRNWWEQNVKVNQARYRQMVEFVHSELPGLFSYIDDGRQGKVCADLFIDDRNFGAEFPRDWLLIIERYGQPESGPTD